MTTKCVKCDGLFSYEPLPGFPGIVPKVCAPCGEAGGGYVADLTAKATAEAKVRLWESLCPAGYRTVPEGGITDQERLTMEHPVEWPDATREKPGLLITGASGHGKTRWMWRVLRMEFDAGKTVLAFTARGFEAAYRDADGNHKLKAFLDECGSVGCFFVDDLGKAGWSPNTLETFYEIVEVRGSNLRPVFITTNFSGDGLVEHMRMDSGIMEPLLRRMREFCRCIAV